MKKITVKITVPLLLFVFVSLFLAAGVWAEEKKFTLKNRYPEGKYNSVMNMDMDMIIEMAGQKMPMKQKMGQYMDIAAGVVQSDGSQKVVMEFTRVTMDQKMAMMDMKYDSADEASKNSPLKAMGVIVGFRLTITFDKDGKIAKVEGLEEFWDKLSKNSDYPPQLAEMLKKQMNAETMTKNYDSHREMMPEKPVAVGESWKSTGSAEMPMIGKMETELDNTLKVVKLVDGVECAEIVSKMKMESKEPGEVEMGPTKMEYKSFSMDGDTTVLMEIATGLVTSTVGDMTLAMELEMKVNDQTMTQKMSGTGKTTTTITRAKAASDSEN